MNDDNQTQSENDQNEEDSIQIQNTDAGDQIFIYITTPPDGGFAWVILLVAFLSIALVDGMIITVGLIFPKVIHDTSLTEFEASVCAAFQNATYHIVAPLICAFANTYGLRIPAVIGGLTASIGLFLSAFSTKFELLVITYGIIVGTGFGLIFSPTVLIVPTYFQKYRVIANGICLAGTGFGTVCVTFLDEYVFYNLNWKSIMFGQSAVCLLLTFLTMLYRPVKPTRVIKTQVSRLSLNISNSSLLSSVEINSIKFFRRSTISEELPLDVTTNNDLSNIRESQLIAKHNNKSDKNKLNLMEWCYGKCFENVCCKNIMKKSSLDYNKDQNGSYIIKNHPLFYNDVFPRSFMSRKDKKKLTDVDHLTAIEKTIARLKFDSKLLAKFENILMSVFRISPMVVQSLEILFDLSIFNYESFKIFLLSALFLALGMKGTYIFITQRAKLHKIPNVYIWWLLPSTGIANMFFRITSSLLQHTFNIEPSLLTCFPLLICGLMNVISGFVLQDNVVFTITLAVVHGGGISFFYALRGAMVAKYFTPDNLRPSFGHHMIFTGIGLLVGQIMTGVFVNLSDNYDVPIIYGGTCIVVSSVLLWTIQYSNARDKQTINNK